MRCTPAARARVSWCSSSGTPAVGNNGFGVEIVSGRSRVPWPPTSKIASKRSPPRPQRRDSTVQRPAAMVLEPSRWWRPLAGHGPLVGGHMGLGGSGPGELLRADEGGLGECLAALRMVQQRADRGGDALLVRLGGGGGVAADLGQRGVRGREDRRAAGH